MSASISDFDLNVIDNMSSDGFYVVSVFGMTLASIAYMAKQFEVKMNWSTMRYRPDAAKYSWLWSNAENMLKDGITNAEEQITQQIVMNPVVKSLDNATNKMNSALSSVSNDVNSLKKKVEAGDLYKDKKNTTLAIELQNNVLALKEGMQKVIASLIIQRHINNDTIKMMSGTRSLQESVRTAVNKVSGQAPVAAPPAVEEPKMIGQTPQPQPVPSKSSGKSSDKSSGKSSDKSSDKSSGKSSDKSSGKSSDKSSGKSGKKKK